MNQKHRFLEKATKPHLFSVALSLSAVLILAITQAGAQSLVWESDFNGIPASALEETEGVVVDGSGNVFSTGLSGNGSGSAIRTMKMNSSGSIQWNVAETKSSLCGGMWGRTPLAQDGAGNLIVVGAEFTNNTSNWNPLFIKYSSSGALVQRLVYNLGPFGSFDAVALDGSGTYIVAHNNPNNGNPHVTHSAKLDAAGNVLWSTSFTPSIFWGTSDGIVTTGSGVYTTSGNKFTKRDSTTGATIWEKDITMPNGGSALATDGTGNVYVMPYQGGLQKYDAAGNLLQAFSAISSQVSDVDVDGAGNVYVVGSTVSSKSGSDILTRKYSAVGNLLWSATAGKSGQYSDNGIAVTVAGGYVYVGASRYNKNLDMSVLKYRAAN